MSNAKLANMANATVKGRTTSGTGNPEDLTMAQLVALIEAQALYALLAGRSGGQTLNGGTAAGENLILHSTAHATKEGLSSLGQTLPMISSMTALVADAPTLTRPLKPIARLRLFASKPIAAIPG
ncbi:MAG: hypothetical protein IPK16_30355 [Anaerolineales bacterium]|nr:hypothetical protein [Anaerolineales bacterium]